MIDAGNLWELLDKRVAATPDAVSHSRGTPAASTSAWSASRS